MKIINRFSFSIRIMLVLVTGFMGMIALALTLVSGEVHTQHFFNHQHLSVQKILQIKSRDLLKELEEASRVLGSGLQASASFRQALLSEDTSSLRILMRNQFNDSFVTTRKLKLEKISVFDASLSSVAEEIRDSLQVASLKHACPEIISQIKRRVGPDKMKLFSDLCFYNGLPFHVTIIPIGGLRLEGYMAITTDPVHNLTLIESALDVPLIIQSMNGELLHQSIDWPSNEDLAGYFVSKYKLKSEIEPKIFISLKVADDIRPLYGDLPQTRMLVMASAAIITVFCIILVMRILSMTMLTPLGLLTEHLRKLRTQPKFLGEKVHVSGAKEVRELSVSFNIMTEELGKLHCALEEMAFTDHLTTLPNRNSFHSRLQQHIATSKPFALFIMDMNYFKAVNDSLGHHIGDMLLVEVGVRLENVLRRSDVIVRLNKDGISGMGRQFIARLGGDEFAAILPDIASHVHAESAVAKIIKAMEEPFHINGHKLLGGISTGIALFPLHATNQDDLMIKADVAMYHAKKTKQGFAIYEEQFNTNSIRELTLGQDLYNAIENEQFILNYQPKINFDTGQICGAEALIRWCHPELGMIPPDEFISIAEKSGLIRQVSAWVIDQALHDCSNWRAKGHDVSVSVNISVLNLNDRDLSQNIQASLVQWSVHPSCLILELTESSIMSNPAHALSVLDTLKDMGVGLSIDDFGTGHSSLAYIKKLPVSEIKIDKSFVHEINENDNEEAIIRSIVILARYLKISLVVEGVEDKVSYERLKEIGCEIAQGYFIAKPMPVDDFYKWMEHR